MAMAIHHEDLKSFGQESSCVDRKLAAILATDVVGYSRLMEQDEAETLERLKLTHKHLVQPQIAKRKGRIVKLMGDGLLAVLKAWPHLAASASPALLMMRSKEN